MNFLFQQPHVCVSLHLLEVIGLVSGDVHLLAAANLLLVVPEFLLEIVAVVLELHILHHVHELLLEVLQLVDARRQLQRLEPEGAFF